MSGCRCTGLTKMKSYGDLHDSQETPRARNMDVMRAACFGADSFVAGVSFTLTNHSRKVHRFDVIRRATLNSVTYNHRKVDLQRSWDEHLSDLVDKFFPGELSW